MEIRRAVPTITTDRLEESRAFYTEFLGFEVAMDLGWIVTLASPSNATAQISLVRGTRSRAGRGGMSVSLEVADVDAIHADAVSRGIRVEYPLTDEPWGVRRFQVNDPNGVRINILSHRK